MTRYFAFAIADGMFPPDAITARKALTPEEAKALIAEGVVSCLNAAHTPTVEAMRALGIEVTIPNTPPKVTLKKGDEFIVMSVRGLPRLTENRHYTNEEIANAEFSFGIWIVLSSPFMANWEFQQWAEKDRLDVGVEKFLDEKIRAFSKRIAPPLKAAGIETLGDLTQKTEEDILCIKNLSTKYLWYITEALREEGLSLKPQ